MSNIVKEEQLGMVFCGWCGRKLGREYYFRCRDCGASFCYVHTSKHLRNGACPRRLRKTWQKAPERSPEFLL